MNGPTSFALLLYTGQRRSDVVRMGRQRIRDGMLHIRQMKTGVELAIPVHPRLGAIIGDMPIEHLTLVTTAFGKPFTAAGFGNWFREQCTAAGLPHCSAHGLRKAAARRLAEAGCMSMRSALLPVTPACVRSSATRGRLIKSGSRSRPWTR